MTPKTFPKKTGLLALGAALGLAASGMSWAAGKQHTGDYRDWSTFVDQSDGGNKICYMRSMPKRWKASKEGVRRGDIYITVSHWPGRDVSDQVSIVTGYTYRKDSKVNAAVDGRDFEMFTEVDGAWLYNETQDKAMVTAMKRGLELKVVGTSSRGTTTTDSYSLRGFTAAYKKISTECGV